MQLIVVRGSTGVVTWSKVLTDLHAHMWVCTRDQFAVIGPDVPGDAESCAVQIAQHSVGLVGAIAQVVQLDL